MKKNVLIGLFFFALASCGGQTESANEAETETINQEEIVEIENATEEVAVGLETLESEVNELNNEIDSLLNDI